MHADSTPSFSVRKGDDGTIQVKCFGPCDLAGDIFNLVAAVHGLDVRRDFRRILTVAADLAGASFGHEPFKLAPPRTYVPGTLPPIHEVAVLWGDCVPILDVSDVAGWMRSRGLDPAAVNAFDLARALPESATLPRWAGQGGRSWIGSGHRCILPLFDHQGALRSVRARRVVDGDTPKTLAPRGFRLPGLVMADRRGRAILAGGHHAASPRIVIAEGDPDYLTWAARFSDADEAAPAVFGVCAGSWCAEIAARIPDGSLVAVRTDRDDAGNKYAAQIGKSLGSRCLLFARKVQDEKRCVKAARR